MIRGLFAALSPNTRCTVSPAASSQMSQQHRMYLCYNQCCTHRTDQILIISRSRSSAAIRPLIYMIVRVDTMNAGWGLCDKALVQMFADCDLSDTVLAQHIITAIA